MPAGRLVRYAEDNLPHVGIVLFGQSMGAAAVLRAIHGRGVKPDAVIVEAVFDRMLTTVRNRFDAMGVPSFPSAELLVFWGGRRAGFDGFRNKRKRKSLDLQDVARVCKTAQRRQTRLGIRCSVQLSYRGARNE